MTFPIGPITITPGITSRNIIPNAGSSVALKVTNGTQYDITFSGYGTSGTSVMPAGTEYLLHATDGNSGYINLLGVDNLNVGGAGIVNMVVYYQNENLPQGNWPVTIPAQRVITPFAGAVVADHLINTGNAASASPIINIQEAGSTGYQMFADNQGNFFVAEYVGGVLTTIFRVIAGIAPGSNSNVLIGDATRRSEVLGSFVVDKTSAFFGQVVATGAQPGVPGIESAAGLNAVGFYAYPNPNNTTGFIEFYAAGNSSTESGTGFAVFNWLSTGFDGSQMNDSATARPFKWTTGDIKNDGTINNGKVNVFGTINNGGAAGIGATINNNSGGGVAATLNNGANGGGPANFNNGLAGNQAAIVNGSSGTSFDSRFTQYGTGSDTQVLQAGAVVLNGGTSGTATLYQYFRGNIKMLVCKLNNFRTAGADQRLAVPVNFGISGSAGVVIMTGDVESCSLQITAGTDLTMRQLTALSGTAGSAGTTIPTTIMNGNMFYNMGNGFNFLNFKSGWTQAHGGIIQIWGAEG